MLLPNNYYFLLRETLKKISKLEGHLSEREAKFLFLIAAYTPAEGHILEIGSFKGKVISIAPHTAPSPTDPHLEGKSSLKDFLTNLKNTGVFDKIEYIVDFSENVGKNWDKPLRVLFIDGDHTYSGVKKDFYLFSPHLANNGVIALHDVLHLFPGPMRVFVEDILSSNSFGPVGLCCSIGWAKYCKDGIRNKYIMKSKDELSKKLKRILSLITPGEKIKGIKKVEYKILRALIPHSEVEPEVWLNNILQS